MDTKIEFKHVGKNFSGNGTTVEAIRDFNLAIPRNKFTTVVGPSGCGKTTLLSLVAGFEAPNTGEVLLDGRPVKGPGPDRGFVFQNHALFPWLTVRQNIMYGPRRGGASRREAGEIADRYIDMIRLNEFRNAYPATLSGGMKQRVGIARALAYDPDVLLMDEPFGALDAQTKKLMQQELTRIWEQTHKTVLFVTHSVIEATYLSDVIVVMSARPGTVKGIVEVDIPRPRSYMAEDYLKVREEVLTLLEEEIQTTKNMTF